MHPKLVTKSFVTVYLLYDTEDVVILYEGWMAKLQKKKLEIVNSKRKNT